eukprot:235114_1
MDILLCTQRIHVPAFRRALSQIKCMLTIFHPASDVLKCDDTALYMAFAIIDADTITVEFNLTVTINDADAILAHNDVVVAINDAYTITDEYAISFSRHSPWSYSCRRYCRFKN